MKRLTVAVMIVTALAAGPVSAQEGGLSNVEQKVAAVLQDHPIVCGTPDLSRLAADVQRWARPIAERLDSGAGTTAASRVLASLKTLEGLASGPAAAWSPDGKNVLLAARVGLAQSGLTKAIANDPELTEQDGVVLVGPEASPYGYLAFRNAFVLGSDNAETLRAALSSGREKPGAGPLPESVAALLELPAFQACSFFVIARAKPVRPAVQQTYEPFSLEGVKNRLTNALWAQISESDWQVCRVTLGERRLSISLWGHLAETATPAASGPRGAPLQFVPLPGNCALALSVAGRDVSVLADEWELLMEALDPDVASEFREELGELDRDLGYSFRGDLLTNLGPAWSVGVLPADGGRQDSVLASRLRDPGAFARQARRLADLSGEPWTRGEPAAGARRFTTRAFTLPLELAIADGVLVMARSTAALREAQAAAAVNGPAGDDGQAESDRQSLELRLTVRWAGLASILPAGGEAQPFREAWGKMPADAAFVATLRRSRSAVRADLELTGTAPEHLAVWLDALRKYLPPPSELDW